jgi:hypothetical protein
VRFKQMGHGLFLEEKEPVLREITDFLKSL